MNKKLCLALMGLAFMSLSACHLKNVSHTQLTGVTGSYGVINIAGLKTFETKGLVFVTVKIDDNYPNNIDYDKSIVADELLKKAQALGADDIVNIRIYRRDVKSKDEYVGLLPFNIIGKGFKSFFDSLQGESPKENIRHSYEYHGSAMAIKYTGTVMQGSNGGQWILTDSGKVIGNTAGEEPSRTVPGDAAKAAAARKPAPKKSPLIPE